jgi:hypothetical protein
VVFLVVGHEAQVVALVDDVPVKQVQVPLFHLLQLAGLKDNVSEGGSCSHAGTPIFLVSDVHKAARPP